MRVSTVTPIMRSSTIYLLVAVGLTAGLPESRVDPRDESTGRLPSPRQTRQREREVKIINFIDTKNTDGSYTFGFEAEDGSYKVETRSVSGEVWGKYGYFDPDGIFREATYGVSLEKYDNSDPRVHATSENSITDNAPFESSSRSRSPTSKSRVR